MNQEIKLPPLPEPDQYIWYSRESVEQIRKAAIELDRQGRGEPVAWYTEDHLTDKSATTWDRTVADRWLEKGWPVNSLFAAPQLASSSPAEVKCGNDYKDNADFHANASLPELDAWQRGWDECNEFNAIESAEPVIRAAFETVDPRPFGATGTTAAKVKRVESNDDGSFTVVIDHWPQPVEPVAWQPIESAPKDNKRLLYLARFDGQGKLVELDFDGIWEYWSESWELPHINGYSWMSASGIEEPTHWAYQDEPLPVAPQLEDGRYENQNQ